MNRIITDISDFIFVSDPAAPVDAIFLPGGSYAELPERAAELYRQGYARWILPSGAYSVKDGCWKGASTKAELYTGDYQTECEFYTDVLIRNGVPAQAIIGEDQAGYTRANAFLSRQAADDRGITVRSAMIVCKAFHARRCLMLYQMAFPETRILVQPVPCAGITRDSWFRSEVGTAQVLGELARCGYQFADDTENYLRQEAEARPPQN